MMLDVAKAQEQVSGPVWTVVDGSDLATEQLLNNPAEFGCLDQGRE